MKGETIQHNAKTFVLEEWSNYSIYERKMENRNIDLSIFQQAGYEVIVGYLGKGSLGNWNNRTREHRQADDRITDLEQNNLDMVSEHTEKFSLYRKEWRIPRWRLEVGSRKRPSYSEILERRWRHTLQA
jgi:uncharacterized protein YbdZ (MbtH family)